MSHLFVTGMLRSGTSLIQVLLTNHPQLFVAYQPYFQFYVDIRKLFLEEHRLKKMLPLGDGLDSNEKEHSLFKQWLKDRRFDSTETDVLVGRAAMFKGYGIPKITDKIRFNPGTFFDIRNQLHILLADHYQKKHVSFIGAKEVLCEEYVPALIDDAVFCLMIVRDPRAVIASACHGGYQKSVGDRYPLLMLIRLWRKSSAYWLAFRNHPRVYTIRYEDLVQNPDETLDEITRWLDIHHFPDGVVREPLRDHAGKIWQGNSSFGDKIGVEPSSNEPWNKLLTLGEIRFIEACTKPELIMLGYSYNDTLQRCDISDFQEDISGVRETYLSNYNVERENRKLELERWDAAERGQYDNIGEKKLFVFPDIFLTLAA